MSVDSTKPAPTYENYFHFGNNKWKFKITPSDTGEYLAQVKQKSLLNFFKIKDYQTAKLSWGESLNSTVFQKLSADEFLIHIKSVEPSTDRPFFEIEITKIESFRNDKNYPPAPTVSMEELEEVSVEGVTKKPTEFLFMNNTLDLVEELKKNNHLILKEESKENDNPLLKEVVDAIIEDFHLRGLRVLQEISPILPFINKKERRKIFDKLLQEIENSRLLNPEALDALTNFLEIIRRDSLKNQESSLTPTDLICILSTLEKKMVKITPSEDGIEKLELLFSRAKSFMDNPNLDPYTHEMRAFVACLELMAVLKVKNLETEPYYNRAKRLLNEFKLDPDIRLAFLSSYGRQVLIEIKKDETSVHSLARHGYFFLKGIDSAIGGVKDIILKKPMAAIEKATEEIYVNWKKALKLPKSEEEWYEVLVELDQSILSGDLDWVVAFRSLFNHMRVGDNREQISEIAKAINTHDPFFIFGFTEILQKVVERQVIYDLSTIRDAIFILENICRDNIDLPKYKEELFKIRSNCSASTTIFIDDKTHVLETGRKRARETYNKQIKDKIYQRLMVWSNQHPEELVKNLAKTSIKNLSLLDPLLKSIDSLELEEEKNFPHIVFDRVLTEVAPWRLGLNNTYKTFSKDNQLNRNMDYYTATDAISPGAPSTLKELNAHIKEFLSSEYDKVLLITGEIGSGKTLSLKYFTNEMWEKGFFKEFIPVFISLKFATNPDEAVKNVMQSFGADLSISKIRSGKGIKILWILDGVDEIKDPFSRSLYIKNELNAYHGSKTIFSCRSSGDLDQNEFRFYPQESDPTGFKRIDILPFDPSKRSDFLTKYLNQKEKLENIDSTWKLSEYEQCFKDHPNLNTLLSTPLYLFIAAETLPAIKNLMDKNPNKKFKIQEVELLNAFFCLTIFREIRKGDCKLKPIDYFNYAIDVAQAFKEIKQTTAIQEDFLPKHRHLFDLDKELLRRCNFLIKHPETGVWSYQHEAFSDYFNHLEFDIIQQKVIKGRLEHNTYQFEGKRILIP